MLDPANPIATNMHCSVAAIFAMHVSTATGVRLGPSHECLRFSAKTEKGDARRARHSRRTGQAARRVAIACRSLGKRAADARR